MNVIPHEKVMRLISGMEAGLSLRRLAEFAGVCKATAASYLSLAEEAEIEVPGVCGCGRHLKHRGRCEFRRNFKPLPASIEEETQK